MNILNAYRTNAFGGRPGLWDFLKDVPGNLNKKKQGVRYNKNTLAFAQTMRIYSGQRMVEFFTFNFANPTYDTVKREDQKGIQFIGRKHQDIFKSVAEIYKAAKGGTWCTRASSSDLGQGRDKGKVLGCMGAQAGRAIRFL
jgi:hypothetical protein